MSPAAISVWVALRKSPGGTRVIGSPATLINRKHIGRGGDALQPSDQKREMARQPTPSHRWHEVTSRVSSPGPPCALAARARLTCSGPVGKASRLGMMYRYSRSSPAIVAAGEGTGPPGGVQTPERLSEDHR